MTTKVDVWTPEGILNAGMLGKPIPTAFVSLADYESLRASLTAMEIKYAESAADASGAAMRFQEAEREADALRSALTASEKRVQELEQDIRVADDLTRNIHQTLKRGLMTPSHGFIGNLRCILDHVTDMPGVL